MLSLRTIKTVKHHFTSTTSLRSDYSTNPSQFEIYDISTSTYCEYIKHY